MRHRCCPAATPIVTVGLVRKPSRAFLFTLGGEEGGAR